MIEDNRITNPSTIIENMGKHTMWVHEELLKYPSTIYLIFYIMYLLYWISIGSEVLWPSYVIWGSSNGFCFSLVYFNSIVIHIIIYNTMWNEIVLITPVCVCTFQWRHNGNNGVLNHQPHDCLLNCLFRRRSKKTPKLRVTGICEGKSSVTGEFLAQRASNAENVSIWWRHHTNGLLAQGLSWALRQTWKLRSFRYCIRVGKWPNW